MSTAEAVVTVRPWAPEQQDAEKVKRAYRGLAVSAMTPGCWRWKSRYADVSQCRANHLNIEAETTVPFAHPFTNTI